MQPKHCRKSCVDNTNYYLLKSNRRWAKIIVPPSSNELTCWNKDIVMHIMYIDVCVFLYYSCHLLFRWKKSRTTKKREEWKGEREQHEKISDVSVQKCCFVSFHSFVCLRFLLASFSLPIVHCCLAVFLPISRKYKFVFFFVLLFLSSTWKYPLILCHLNIYEIIIRLSSSYYNRSKKSGKYLYLAFA